MKPLIIPLLLAAVIGCTKPAEAPAVGHCGDVTIASLDLQYAAEMLELKRRGACAGYTAATCPKLAETRRRHRVRQARYVECEGHDATD